MSTLLRATARTTMLRQSPAAIKGVRGVHIENTVYNNMPFQYRNKKAFAFKTVAFLGFGFSIPILAAGYQLRKAAAAASEA
ncbi:uncharacterized protein EI90DRAFT_2995067 [Cantharellus anzutake]|uniref:uncharacterized protein n=1 Tax=Cantharellus anzutake TaxID=1750568 RepID=UPI001905E1DC|nr:uncharacterized protein EI90DRAFT_2995067 [Cantharellus anzutake]KAF8332772.1 hypothetical protein EI90DRAFT_2995067 [Cantharellus anzutake]